MENGSKRVVDKAYYCLLLLFPQSILEGSFQFIKRYPVMRTEQQNARARQTDNTGEYWRM